MHEATTTEHHTHLNYRAYMACTAKDGWLADAEGQLAAWLREKDFDVDLSENGPHVDGARSLSITRRESSDGTSFFARLVETDTPQGTWTTELLAQDARGKGDWLTLNVTNDRDSWVAVPRLGRYLMQTLPLTDGLLEFVDTPRSVHSRSLDDLIDVLCDEERHGLVFVAGSAHDQQISFDTYVDQVDTWTKQVYGLAQVVVLDPDATQALQAAIGETHAVRPWTIRTYLPGLDPAARVDARRHRFLGTQSLAENTDRRVQRLLGGIARAHASARLLPKEVVRVRRALDRLDNQAILRAITPEVVESTETTILAGGGTLGAQKHSHPTKDHETGAHEEQVALVMATLGLRELTRESLQEFVEMASAPRADERAVARAGEQIDHLQDRVEELEDSLANATRALDDGQEDLAELQDSFQDTEAETRWLRTRLAGFEEWDAAYGLVPDEWRVEYPESFGSLLDRIAKEMSDTVIFCGDVDTALRVDDNDSLQLAVRMCWEVCLALSDYVRARTDGALENGVDYYLRHTPSGYRNVSAGKHAASETSVTMQRYGHERNFAVPVDVNAGGAAEMTAHFKLARIGMVSPRLYYLDNFSKNGLVYIGYIGPHLTNTMTN